MEQAKTVYQEFRENGGTEQDWREFLEDLDQQANDEEDWDQ